MDEINRRAYEILNDEDGRYARIAADLDVRRARDFGADAAAEWRTPPRRKQSAPAPEQPRATAMTMDAATQAKWDEWAKSLIAPQIMALADESGATCGRLERLIRALTVKAGSTTGALEKRIHELETEVAALRADLHIQRSISNGEITRLKGEVSGRVA
jgi:hypothetical protein